MVPPVSTMSLDGVIVNNASSVMEHCANNTIAIVSPGPSLRYSSDFDESCVDIGLLLKSTSQAGVRCFSSSKKYAILIIILNHQEILNFLVDILMVVVEVVNILI